LNGVELNQTGVKNANFTLNQTINLFESRLKIDSAYQVKHYKWVRHCSRSGCWVSCDYYKTDNIVNHLDISDGKNTELYNFTYNASYLVDRNLSRVFDYWLAYSVPDDFAEAFFKANNSFIRSQGVKYRLISSNPPYNTFSFEAIRTPSSTSIYGVSVLQNNHSTIDSRFLTKMHVFLPKTNDCSMTFRSHFDLVFLPNFCDLSTEYPVIDLSLVNSSNDTLTLKVRFYENTTNLPLSNKLIHITFSGYEAIVTTNDRGEAIVSLPHLKGNQLIKADFETDMTTKSAETVLVFSEIRYDLEELGFYSMIGLPTLALLANYLKRSIFCV
jgi:hypothetical protein